MQAFIAIILIGILFIGCNNNDDLSSSISTSFVTSQEVEKSLDFDKKTYAGLENIFQDTGNIETHGKYMMIVFGINGCKYCEMFKEDMKHNPLLQNEIQTNFSAYYVNLSYSKQHHFKVGEKDSTKEYTFLTRDLVNIYNIDPTPTFIFTTKSGEVILNYQGYIPPNQFQALLSFILSDEWKKANGDNEKIQESLQTYMTNQTL